MVRLMSTKKGAKRHRITDDTRIVEIPRKNEKMKAKSVEGTSNSTGCSEESSQGTSSDGVLVLDETSTYDNLLMSLKLTSESFHQLSKKRQRAQEGKIDSEDGNNEFLCASEIFNEEYGSENVSKSNNHQYKPINYQSGDLMESSDEDMIGELDSDSDRDQVDDTDDLRNCDLSATNASLARSSSFNVHLEHKLSEADIEVLSQQKWKFKFELPVVDIHTMRWIGTTECFLEEVAAATKHGVKLRLFTYWLTICKSLNINDTHDSKWRLFFSLCKSYCDVMHCHKKPFYLKGREEDSYIMDAYIMHTLNHVYRTRDLVTKNDSKFSKDQDSFREENLGGERFLDQGFTRPKVLFLLPMRSIAFRVIKRLIELTPPKYRVNVEHIDRFCDEFGAEEGNDGEDSDAKTSKNQGPSKPRDFQVLFGENNDDHFMIGIKFTRRSIKLYNDFYSSDVIVASPLALVTKMGEAEVEKDRDVDYLSSIEILIIDHSDVIAMQNWSHVNTVVEQLNCMPSKQHGTDVMRIRQWYLDGHAKFYRQTILLGAFVNPDMNSLFSRHCVNHQGKVKLITTHKGVLSKVLLLVRQVYQRFDATSIIDADDARLNCFANKFFPKIKDSVQGGIMLFISSYFEFVRVRNFLKSQNASFCMLGEYTKPSDISRARIWFFEGRRKIILYTERAHFYHRYKIRGIKNLIMYSLPERKEFYPELLNMLDVSEDMNCTVLFSKFDHLQLERIVGSTTTKRMLSSKKDFFVFC